MTESHLAALPPFVVAIPARYASTRLPGKPLADLAGKPLVVRVVERAELAGASTVVVATDDARIRDAVQRHCPQITVCMTDTTHRTGSDRLAECAHQLAWDDDAIVINLQGDEPFAPVAGIRAVVQALTEDDAPMATLFAPIVDAAELFDPNVVKIVADDNQRALYFSRAPIPWARDDFAVDRTQLPSASSGMYKRHIGIYGYRAGFLRHFAALAPSHLETLESLEQLRALAHGHAIAVRSTPQAFPPGIDTPDDLSKAQALFERER